MTRARHCEQWELVRLCLWGELVNENSREEPVSLKYSEGLIIVSSGSSSACV